MYSSLGSRHARSHDSGCPLSVHSVLPGVKHRVVKRGTARNWSPYLTIPWLMMFFSANLLLDPSCEAVFSIVKRHVIFIEEHGSCLFCPYCFIDPLNVLWLLHDNLAVSLKQTFPPFCRNQNFPFRINQGLAWGSTEATVCTFTFH